jgi:hypothetical protein
MKDIKERNEYLNKACKAINLACFDPDPKVTLRDLYGKAPQALKDTFVEALILEIGYLYARVRTTDDRLADILSKYHLIDKDYGKREELF